MSSGVGDRQGRNFTIRTGAAQARSFDPGFRFSTPWKAHDRMQIACRSNHHQKEKNT
jgi:hypothetical protein